jgi:pyridoxal phosphate enzyme (YggS family)
VATVTATHLAERLADVRARIERAGGDWREITLVAVTKEHPWAPAAALAAGLQDLGENRVERIAEHADDEQLQEVRWHLIGEIQRRKVRAGASVVHLWQTVDRLEEGEALADVAPGARVLVQLNLTGEQQKQGCPPDDAPKLVEGLQQFDLDVLGLMGMGLAGDPESARPGFRKLVALAEKLELPVRSIGMSADLEVAVQEGSTMVRIGSALFGPRPEPRAARR